MKVSNLDVDQVFLKNPILSSALIEYITTNKNRVDSYDTFYELVTLHPEFNELQKRVNYTFKNKHLFVQSLLHRSFFHEYSYIFKEGNISNNERLEFLGDTILNSVVSIEIYNRHADLNEGECSKLRGSIVREATLFKLSKYLELSNLVLIGKGELKNKGNYRPSILSDLLEAIIGAIYLDSTFEIISEVWANLINNYKEDFGIDIYNSSSIVDFDYKSSLQEFTMANFRSLPVYESEEFMVGSRVKFKVKLIVDGKEIATCEDYSKKKAEIKLAKDAIKILKEVILC